MAEQPDYDFNFPERSDASSRFVTDTPTGAQLTWLKRAVRNVGGTLLTAVCRPRGLSYPTIKNVRSVMVNSCACGNETMVMLPYDTQGGDHSQVKLCLVCDGLAAAPRLDSLEAVPPPAADPPPFNQEERHTGE